jgi:hypothetical protein
MHMPKGVLMVFNMDKASTLLGFQMIRGVIPIIYRVSTFKRWR